MAVNIKFWQFGKKENSTKKPETTGTAYTCLFKEPVNLMNPIITLQHENPVGYNYAYIGTFGRYYFVTNWEYERGLWHAELKVDVLASWKAEIGESNQYVLRSASSYDGSIIDLQYPAKTSPDIVYEYKDFSNFVYSFSSGSFVVGIITSQTAGVGAVNYYIFTSANFRKFCNNLLSNADWCASDITEISQSLFKALFNPFQYIVSCIWVPINIATGGTQQTIQIGWNWGIAANCKILTGSTLYGDSIDFTVPPHPDAQSRGLYLHSAPYSQYVLTVPMYGRFPLDANLASQAETITCQIDIDAVTGMGRLQARGAGYTFVDVTAMVGVPIQLAQITQGVNSISQGVASMAGTAVAGTLNAFDKALGGNTGVSQGKIAAISSALATAGNQVSTIGSNGSIAGLGPAKFEAVFYHPVSEDLSHFGRPLCKEVKINTLNGYVLCDSADISTIATRQENVMINNYLNGGFFYE